MKIIESVKVILAEPGHSYCTKIIANVKDCDSSLELAGIQRHEEVDLSRLVRWPIDIHIDGGSKGATVTLRMHVSELELHGLVVKAEEPVDGKL